VRALTCAGTVAMKNTATISFKTDSIFIIIPFPFFRLSVRLNVSHKIIPDRIHTIIIEEMPLTNTGWNITLSLRLFQEGTKK